MKEREAKGEQALISVLAEFSACLDMISDLRDALFSVCPTRSPGSLQREMLLSSSLGALVTAFGGKGPLVARG
jgi:hypothetical protein